MTDHRQECKQQRWDSDLYPDTPSTPVPPLPVSTPPIVPQTVRQRSGSGLSVRTGGIPPTQPTGPSIAELEHMDLRTLRRLANDALKETGETDV